MGTIKNWGKTLARKILKGTDPNFLIIGAQKSGTTTLHYFLDQHPKIRGSFPKEIHYFSRYINYPGKDLDWYRRHFASWKDYEHHFESSPNYLSDPKTPQRIHEHYPDIKMIALLRDPIQRAYSAWNMYHDYLKKGYAAKRLAHGTSPGKKNELFEFFYRGRTSFPTFLETIEAEISHINENRPGGPNILRKGLYHEQLSRYFEYFKRDQILILDFNELVKEPTTLCNKALAFLNVDDTTTWQPKVKVKNKRGYDYSITENERMILERFYEEPDRKLFELMNTKPMW